MQVKCFFLLLVAISLSGICHAQTDTVIRRYRAYLLGSSSTTGVRQDVRTLGPQGAWPDIDYAGTNRSVWEAMTHLSRLQSMAAAWANPRSALYHNDSLDQAVNRAFDYWLYHRFYNPNWWYNEIGVPQYVLHIMILRSARLSHYQRIRGLEQIGQYRINGTGSNLVWSAELGFHYGALTGDTTLMRHCIDTIIHEVRITTGEGIQPDYSFHMHGNRLEVYGYGTAFLKENVLLAMQCRGTPWAYPSDRIRLLVDFVLKGCQWMARGVHTVPGTLDRGITGKGALDGADLRALIPSLISLCPSEAPALRALAARQGGSGTPLTGFRYFPYSDFAVYHQKGFSFFLKTISTRTLPSESINGENLKGRLLNSGDAYLVDDGSEYFNLMPVWYWDRLPGITTFPGATEILRKPFVGSVSDGQSGLTAMDYLMGGAGREALSAHKIWICHQGFVLCLIAGLTAHHLQSPVVTILDQCRWQGPVTVNGSRSLQISATDTLHGVRWIRQGNFAYMPITSTPVVVFADTVSGSWSSVTSAGSDSLCVDSLFAAMLFHGSHPKDQASAYVLVGVPSARKMKQLVDRPPWNILRNDTICQAVRFSDGMLGAAFFAQGALKLPGGGSLSVSRPCLVLLSGDVLYVSDLSHMGGECTVEVRGRTVKLTLPDVGTSVSRRL